MLALRDAAFTALVCGVVIGLYGVILNAWLFSGWSH